MKAALALGACGFMIGAAGFAAAPGDKPGGTSGYRLGEQLAPVPASVLPQSTVRQLNWDALVPADWDPMKVFKGIDLGKLSDADPRAMAALERLRTEWNNAPAKASLHGTRIRIPGFVVPLESSRDQLTEFLLVPYFGACIHSPPPPSNQIIHVFAKSLLRNVRAMDAVWAVGVIETARSETGMGNAGYRMNADSIEPYRKPHG